MLRLPDAPRPEPTAPLSQRVSTRVAGWLERRRPGRRSFLRRAAMVGTALAVNPFDFILRPGTAYATVCGPANECSQGWSAFCCTINGGANTCPDGSYAAGWWKVSSSAFCRGEDRYVVDCNRLPEARCTCHCADGECDRRRVCCNNFRYGQCNQQIPGTTEVVCRIVICTPPWEWDETCTTTVRTDERTRDHSSSCLNGPNPTVIAVAYQDMGLVGAPVGTPTGEERGAPRGGAWRPYDNGVLTHLPDLGVRSLAGPAGVHYAAIGGPDSALGYLVGDTADVAGGTVGRTEHGAIYASPSGATGALHGPIAETYRGRGGPTDWLGFPVTDVVAAPGGRQRAFFTSGWSLAHDPSTGETKLVPSDVELPDTAGEWPPTAPVERTAGADRAATAAQLSAATFPDGAPTAVVASGATFPDALAGGVLAGAAGGPVLLTAVDALPVATRDELMRLAPGTVSVIGGAGVVTDAVVEEIRSALPDADVRRLAGPDRFATAVAVADAQREAAGGSSGGDDTADPDGGEGPARPEPGPDEPVPELLGSGPGSVVYLANGNNFPDALCAGPAAVRADGPLLLTAPDALPEPTREALSRYAPDEVVVVGGPAAVSDEVMAEAAEASGGSASRIAGPSRFDTAVAVAESWAAAPVPAVLVATGEGFADALSAGATSSATGSPLLLATSAGVPLATRQAIARLEPSALRIIGGTGPLPELVAEQLRHLPSRPYPSREDPAHPSPSGDTAASGSLVPDLPPTDA